MTVSYKKLWKLCIDKDINKTKLRELSGLSPANSTIIKRRSSKYGIALANCKCAEMQHC